jgi:hypothetical protein
MLEIATKREIKQLNADKEGLAANGEHMSVMKRGGQELKSADVCSMVA